MASFASECRRLSKRRARDSNPQLLAEHLNSNQAEECKNAEEYADSQLRAAPGAAVSAQTTPLDPDLQLVIEAWETLPEATKIGILAMVRAAREATE